MAKLKAYQAFDLTNFDLNLLIRNQFDFNFLDDVYETYQGVRYEDVLAIDYYIGGDFYAVVFAGKDVTWTSDFLKVTSGTVQAVGELVWNGSGYDWLYALQGLSLRATDVFDAVSTSQRGDDLVVIRNALGGADHMVMSRFDDKVSGYDGADVIDGKTGHDDLYGGEGDDTLLGRGGSDDLFGEDGNDKLFGHAGRDALAGQDGEDKIDGGAGRDVIDGGRGNDTLRGGGGKDVFVFRKGDGSDTILDFNANTDLIEIGRGASDFDHLSLKQIGADVLVEFSGVSILLQDLGLRELASDNFIF